MHDKYDHYSARTRQDNALRRMANQPWEDSKSDMPIWAWAFLVPAFLVGLWLLSL